MSVTNRNERMKEGQNVKNWLKNCLFNTSILYFEQNLCFEMFSGIFSTHHNDISTDKEANSIVVVIVKYTSVHLTLYKNQTKILEAKFIEVFFKKENNSLVYSAASEKKISVI